MTISTTSNKTVVQGNGLTNSFTYKFLVPNASEMFVYYTDAAGVSTLLNSSQYSVSGLGNPNGGTVTYPLTGSPIASGTSLTIIRILAYQQLTDLINQGGYYPEVVEAALDYLTMLTQQLSEAQNRALTLAVEADGSISVVLPVPQANYLIAWNSGANGLTNVSPASLAGIVTYGTWTAQTFNGDGTTTDFVLSSDPLTAANIDVSVGAAVQRVAIDYTYIGANTVRFSTPPPVGANNVFMRWGSSLPLGVATSVAGQTTFGTSIIQAANAGAAIALLGAVDTSTAQTINGQKTFGLRPIMPTAAPGTSDTGGANTQFVLGTYAQVRQTVLQGVTNSGGYANMLSVGTGLAINLSAATTPMITSFAQGVGNAAATLSANVTGVVSGLPANNLSYITQAYVSPTSVTWGYTLAPPQYGYSYVQSAQSKLDLNNSNLDSFGNAWTNTGVTFSNVTPIIPGTYMGVFNGSSYFRTTAITSLGGGSWTVRGKMKLGSVAAGTIMNAGNASSFGAFSINLSSGKLNLYLGSTGSSFDIANGLVSAATLTTGTSYDYELTFDQVAGKYFFYINGVPDASLTVASTAKVAGFSNVTIGANSATTAANFTTGSIQGVEMLPYCAHPNGVTFTPSTALSNIAAPGYASDFFSIPNMTMYQVSGASTSAGNDPLFTAKNFVYVGEAITGASTVSSVVNYALRGEYDSGYTMGLPANGVSVVKNHNIGVTPDKKKLLFKCATADQGQVPGEVVDGAVQAGTISHLPSLPATSNTITFTQGSNGGSVEIKGTGAWGNTTAAFWAYKIMAGRGW